MVSRPAGMKSFHPMPKWRSSAVQPATPWPTMEASVLDLPNLAVNTSEDVDLEEWLPTRAPCSATVHTEPRRATSPQLHAARVRLAYAKKQHRPVKVTPRQIGAASPARVPERVDAAQGGATGSARALVTRLQQRTSVGKPGSISPFRGGKFLRMRGDVLGLPGGGDGYPKARKAR